MYTERDSWFDMNIQGNIVPSISIDLVFLHHHMLSFPGSIIQIFGSFTNTPSKDYVNKKKIYLEMRKVLVNILK